ncbi:hypothetical protein L3V82_07610 [Thiotrichales bacterium 19S3-7]|nr:hypothetical protein [Thiotrichales bacterium 19S3-7]MCF6802024.1 hypothetical protein [Thiotrichales bacterium 19S3-11]
MFKWAQPENKNTYGFSYFMQKKLDKSALIVAFDKSHKSYYSNLGKDLENYENVDKKIQAKFRAKVGENCTVTTSEITQDSNISKTTVYKHNQCIIKQNHNATRSEIHGKVDAKLVANMIKVNGGKAYIYGSWKLNDFKNVLKECSNIGIDLHKIYLQTEYLHPQQGKKDDFKSVLNIAQLDQKEKIEQIKRKIPSLFPSKPSAFSSHFEQEPTNQL